jgi:hypothetical protein
MSLNQRKVSPCEAIPARPHDALRTDLASLATTAEARGPCFLSFATAQAFSLRAMTQSLSSSRLVNF